MRRKKQGNGRQLNNAGFSLVELLVAIVVLAVIVVPLMHSFVSAARTNAKARHTMHATASAENVMEEFEAYSIAEMAATYTAAGYTMEQDLDVDGDGAVETGSWRFRGTDSVTTSNTYDMEISLDPSDYGTINSAELVDIQNLAGNLNAVYVESEADAKEAYGVFAAYAGGLTVDEIAPYVSKEVSIEINSDRITLDLGAGESVTTDVYLVTASVFYQCDSSILATGAPSKYPQNNNEYVIFSNEETVRKKAADIKAKKAAGTPLEKEDVVISKLANVVICLQPRYDICDSMIGAKDSIFVDNSDNVDANLFLVKQDLSTTEQTRLQSKWHGSYESKLEQYPLYFQLKESAPGWMSSAGASIQSHCRLRTNLLEENKKITYEFYNINNSQKVAGIAYRNPGDLSFTEGGGTTGGRDALTILQADTLTPAKSDERMYDITVRVYEQGTLGVGIPTADPLVTMTGTVTDN